MLQGVTFVVCMKLASVTTKQTIISCKPYLIVILDNTCRIAAGQRSKHRCDVILYQLTIADTYIANPTVVAHHNRTTSIDIAHAKLGCGCGTRCCKYRRYLTILIKSNAHYLKCCGYPHTPFRVAISADTPAIEQLMQLLGQLRIDTRRHNRMHCLKVEHLRSFLKSNPQTAEIILAYITTTVTAQCRRRGCIA